MKTVLHRFSPRKDTGFFSQAKKHEFPGLRVFMYSIATPVCSYAVSVQTGRAVQRNAVKRELRTWLQQHLVNFRNKKVFIIVLNWEKAKTSLPAVLNLV